MFRRPDLPKRFTIFDGCLMIREQNEYYSATNHIDRNTIKGDNELDVCKKFHLFRPKFDLT